MITAGGPLTFCAGGSVTLTSSLGTSYLWSEGSMTQSINPSISGSYTVQVTNAAGCQSAASAATVVTVNALPATPTITASGPLTFCAGGSVTLTSSLGSSYLWSTGTTTASITPAVSGSYTVQVTNASGCQSAASAATVVTVNVLPSPTVSGATEVCDPATEPYTTLSVSGNSYLWSVTGGSISGSSAGNTVLVDWAGVGAGTVSVTEVIDATGCGLTTPGYSVTKFALPAIGTINSDNALIRR
jgi:hypothetical protein